ncbi:hypothetical protein [Kribbella sp. NPDC051718]|uniref:hypothetical protein n=1 Tax=Kribbella sp. NPDC051718 TaxID=3155168 RepID=UPI003417835F
MAEEYGVFLDTGLGLGEVAEQLKGALGLGASLEGSGGDGEVGLRGPGLSGVGVLGVSVHRNWHVLVDAEVGEAQAIDPYGVQVDVLDGGGDEARAVFERLAGAGLGMAMLLVEDVTYLVAAYLPDVGTHYFAAGVSMDEPDIEAWRGWVSEVRMG